MTASRPASETHVSRWHVCHQGSPTRGYNAFDWALPEGQGVSGIRADKGEPLEGAIVGLQISIRKSGDVTILDLQGRATIGVDSDLLNSHLQKLVANGVRKLLLNLADVTQLDSSGISAITGTYVSLRRQGGSLKLLCPWGRVRAVLRVIRLPDMTSQPRKPLGANLTKREYT